jgi:hypothetical protein
MQPEIGTVRTLLAIANEVIEQMAECPQFAQSGHLLGVTNVRFRG